jgi:serine acetyltransferase
MREPPEASVQKGLLDQKKSAFRKYSNLFIGKKGFTQFVKYEIIILLFSWIPGALGLFLRRIFYPLLLKKTGRGVAFGRNITLHHPHKITVGDHSSIDDYAVLDAKGEGNQGITVGQNVIVGRNTILSC